jgi:2-haloacid dehalogenase
MSATNPSTRAYDAILFDLLTALLDSWKLWNSVAGSKKAGRRWRAEYLKITYAAGGYRPYEDLVAKAAHDVGLSRDLAKELGARYAELQPWPGVRDALARLHGEGIPLGVVTNCSEELGRIAANCVGVPFTVLVTAERAGYYKPQPQPYQLALSELRVEPHRCLFVAGSAYDLFGTAKVGLPTWWHNRANMIAPENAPAPLVCRDELATLPAYALGGCGNIRQHWKSLTVGFRHSPRTNLRDRHACRQLHRPP